MANETVSSPAPRKRRRWLRVIGWILGVLIVLLVVAYFVGTSSAFFKGVILPKVSAALNAKVTVSDASISPFRQVVLRDLKVQTTGAEPLVSAPEVLLRYSLMAIIRGDIKVDEVSLNAPTVTLLENPDGTSNLDPILKAQQKPAEQPSKPSKPSPPSKPTQIDIKQVALRNGTIRQIKLSKRGERDLLEVANVNVTVDNLKNSQTGKLALAADIKMENTAPAPAPSGLLQAKVNGAFDLALSADLKPTSIQGNTTLNVSRAEGSLAQAAAFGANLNCNVTPTEIKEVALRFQKGGTPLGELLVNGPFNMEKTEGKITVQLLKVDKNLLNLAGASSGLDFGPTTITSTNQIELANGGSTITTVGQFNLDHLQVTRTNQTTPPMDLRSDYNLTVDQRASNVVVRALNLAGTQKGNQFLHGELTSPMIIAWGKTNNAIGDSTLNVTVSHLDLADWKAFAGDVAPTGDVNAKLQLLSQSGGSQLKFDANAQIANLTVVSGTNRLEGAGVTLQAQGQAADLDQADRLSVNLPTYRLAVTRQDQPLINLSGSAVYKKADESTDAQMQGEILLAKLLQAFPQPDMNVSSGTATLKAHVVQKKQDQTVTGTFALADFTGRFGSNVFQNFGTTADLDLAMNPQQVQIRKVNGQLTEGKKVGGTFDVNGSYDLTNKSTQLKLLANFNEAGLRAFLQPALGDKKLMSVALNANAAVQYDPKAASVVKADLVVTNLVVNDPKGQIPAKPLEARARVDASMNKDIADLKEISFGLTPTALATNNEVRLSGRVDLSDTNAISGNLKLAADALDLTTYYDLFAAKTGGPEKPAAAPSQPAPATPPSAPAQPEAGKRQMRNFVAEAAIGAVYLHEIRITNVQTTVKMDRDRIVVTPCKLWLNGAPADANVDLDLGIPGYKYNVAANALAIPLAPIVNSFEPDRKGQIGGTLTAQAKVTGQGTSGADLKKNLAGNFDVATTNLNLSVINIRSPLLKAVINVVALIPDLVKNPDNMLGSALAAIAPQPGAGRTGGLAGELEKSPIDKIVARGTMGGGQVVLQQAMVQSSTFQADATGNVQLQDVLTNSTINIPVALSLSQSVAQRVNLVPPNTPTNAAYVKLPEFLTLTGTLGNPGKQINKMALVGLAARGLSGIGGQAGGILGTVGGLLGGKSQTGTNAPPTGTNRPAGGLGNIIGGFLGGSQPGGTNAPATNQSPAGNLLNQLFKKK